LAQELAKRAADYPVPSEKRLGDAEQNQDGRLPVLVEVNVGGEVQKSGCEPEELSRILDTVEACSSLRLAGLMTVPPFTDETAESLSYFEQLVEHRERQGGAKRLPELSMGMTLDLEYAIAAGATMVRVGTAIFGERPPHQVSP
jgi:hypothetical protein